MSPPDPGRPGREPPPRSRSRRRPVPWTRPRRGRPGSASPPRGAISGTGNAPRSRAPPPWSRRRERWAAAAGRCPGSEALLDGPCLAGNAAKEAQLAGVIGLVKLEERQLAAQRVLGFRRAKILI